MLQSASVVDFDSACLRLLPRLRLRLALACVTRRIRTERKRMGAYNVSRFECVAGSRQSLEEKVWVEFADDDRVSPDEEEAGEEEAEEGVEAGDEAGSSERS